MGSFGPTRPKRQIETAVAYSSSLGGQTDTRPERENPSRPPLGTINVIFAAPGRTGSWPSRVMSVAHLSPKDGRHESKRAKLDWRSEERRVGKECLE